LTLAGFVRFFHSTPTQQDASMSRSKDFRPLLIAGVVFIAGGSVAAGLTGADAAKARIDHMKGQGAAMKAIGDQLKTGAPDMAVIKVQAAKLEASSRELTTWFPAGSGQSAYAKSKALPVIWTDKAKFAEKAEALRTAVNKLNAVAQAGDAAAVGPAVKEVGAACKGCHETFKAKDET
jgi:cytochrome c556